MKKVIIAMACVLGLALVVNNAQAATTLSQGDRYYVGSINDGIPSNPVAELGYIKELIKLVPGADNTDIGTQTYNREGSAIPVANLPSITGVFNYKEVKDAYTDPDADAELDGSWTFNLDEDFYILGKYDAGAAGALVWFVDAADFDFGDVFTLPAKFNGHDLSHLSVYSDGSPVPIPGSLVLFGSGLIGLAGITRRRFRA